MGALTTPVVAPFWKLILVAGRAVAVGRAAGKVAVGVGAIGPAVGACAVMARIVAATMVVMGAGELGAGVSPPQARTPDRVTVAASESLSLSIMIVLRLGEYNATRGPSCSGRRGAHQYRGRGGVSMLATRARHLCTGGEPDSARYNPTMRKLWHLTLSWGPAIVMMSIIFFFSSRTRNSLPNFG